MAKSKKGSAKSSAHPVKAGRNRAPNLVSYRDRDGKRHWRISSSA